MFNHVHQSGRFDRSMASLSHAVQEWHDRASLVTHTEMGYDEREGAFVGHEGWSYFRAKRDRGADECVVEWRDSLWEPAGRAWSKKLTDETYIRAPEYGGGPTPPVHATTVPLRHRIANETLVVTVAHMPVLNTARRQDVWDAAIGGWRKHIRELRRLYPGAYQLVVADWNLDYRTFLGRRRLKKAWGSLDLSAAWHGNVPVDGGTHGKRRLIDGDYTDLDVRKCVLLPRNKSSDHRAYMATYRWPK